MHKEGNKTYGSILIAFLRRVKVSLNVRVYRIIGYLCYRFFTIFPLQNKVVATAFQGMKYGDNPAYVLEAIKNIRPDIKLMWMCDTKCDLPQWIKAIPYSGLWIPRYHLATAKVVIDTHHFPIWTKKRKGQLFIETWHGGPGIKKLELEVPEFQNFQWLTKLTAHTCAEADVFISQSEHLSKVYKSAFHYEGTIFKCGYPKNDILVNRNPIHRQAVREFYHMDDDTKILLYAPTYRNYFFDNIDLSQFILDTDALSQKLEKKFGGKWVIMCRWHPKFAQQLSAEYQRQKLSAIDSTEFQDVQRLLLGVDCVISDYSSIIFDAALLDIPCFTFATDFDTYKAERGVYYEMEELPFPYARTFNDLEKNIENYDHDAYLLRWKAFKHRMGLFEPGNASEAIANKITKFVDTGATHWKQDIN